MERYRKITRTLLRDSLKVAFPDDDEIDLFVTMAVKKYSFHRPRMVPYTLTLEAGIKNYPLPDDWVRADTLAFSEAIYPPGVNFDLTEFTSFVLPNINMSYPLKELTFKWYDENRNVVVQPTPQASMSIDFAYYAAHIVDDTQCTIGAFYQEAVCQLATSYGLRELAVTKGQRMQKYKIGQGLQIDDSDIPVHLERSANKHERAFLKIVVDVPFGVMG